MPVIAKISVIIIFIVYIFKVVPEMGSKDMQSITMLLLMIFLALYGIWDSLETRKKGIK